jgi:hypothetical protein
MLMLMLMLDRRPYSNAIRSNVDVAIYVSVR